MLKKFTSLLTLVLLSTCVFTYANENEKKEKTTYDDYYEDYLSERKRILEKYSDLIAAYDHIVENTDFTSPINFGATKFHDAKYDDYPLHSNIAKWICPAKEKLKNVSKLMSWRGITADACKEERKFNTQWLKSFSPSVKFKRFHNAMVFDKYADKTWIQAKGMICFAYYAQILEETAKQEKYPCLNLDLPIISLMPKIHYLIAISYYSNKQYRQEMEESVDTAIEFHAQHAEILFYSHLTDTKKMKERVKLYNMTENNLIYYSRAMKASSDELQIGRNKVNDYYARLVRSGLFSKDAEIYERVSLAHAIVGKCFKSRKGYAAVYVTQEEFTNAQAIFRHFDETLNIPEEAKKKIYQNEKSNADKFGDWSSQWSQKTREFCQEMITILNVQKNAPGML